ncbi:MAG: hypothetical protein AAGE01_24210 [Pseudomonadota bacterium]
MSQQRDKDSAESRDEPSALTDEELDAVSGGIGAATRGPGQAKPLIGLEQEGFSDFGRSRKDLGGGDG